MARIAGWIAGLAIAVPALTLTALRLTGTPDGWPVLLQAFTPYALPAYGVLLVVLAVVALRGVRTWLPAAGAVVAALGLTLHLVWVGPLLSAEAAPSDASGTLTVMTANLRLGEGDGAGLVRAAIDRDVDLLVVQELTPAAGR